MFSSMSEERCVLCLDEKRSPVRISCGHSFCHECLDIYKSYRKYTWANKCPICRGALKETKRSVKQKLSTSNDSNVQDPNESVSSGSYVPIDQDSLLEELMARAANDSDTSLISLNIEHLNSSDMYSSTDVTPVPNSDSDNEMFAAEDADDVDEHDEERIFSDLDEDTFYYFEDDSSWAEAYEDYEEDVILDPEDSVLVHNESWLSTGSGGGGSGGGGGAHSEYNPSDSDVQIIDDVIVVD